MTPRSWEKWVEYYEGKGYRVLAPAYPGLEVEVEALREKPSPIEALSVPAIVERYEGIKVVPVSQIRSLFPILRNPANRHRAVGFTPEQFLNVFANTLSGRLRRSLRALLRTCLRQASVVRTAGQLHPRTPM
jgi:hypothetical protein